MEIIHKTMATNVSLKDLAKLLKLAPSTISRALRDHPDISKKTKDLVKQEAERLGYAPDALARSLRNRRTNLTAVIVPQITDYFYTEVLEGMMQHARSNGYNIIIYESRENQEEEASICRSICKSGIEGVMISPAKTTKDTAHFEALKACGIALVLFDRIGGNVDADQVAGDNFNGAYQAVTHLIEGGCRRIAHFAAPQHIPMAQKRQLGYMKALTDHKIAIDNNLIINSDDRETAISATFDLLEQQSIDGIFAVNDQAATGALYALRQMRLRVPEDVAVCGYGNLFLSRVTNPGLTSVEAYAREMGQAAAKLLQKRILERDSTRTETQLIKPTLIIRESTRQIFR